MALLSAGSPAAAQPAAPVAPVPAPEQPQVVRIAYMSRAVADQRPAVYGLPPRQSDEGIQGGRLGLEDNATTGRFAGQRFELSETVLADDADPALALRARSSPPAFPFSWRTFRLAISTGCSPPPKLRRR